MAKVKTADDLEREAQEVLKKARKEQQALLQKAKKLREEKYIEIGKKSVEFIKGDVTKEQLETFIVNSGFVKKEELISDENGTTDSGSFE